MNSYNTIVRDKVPQILQKSGVNFDLEILPKDKNIELLYTTLIAYIYESLEKKSLTEIVESIDLLTSIALEYGYTEKEISMERDKINIEKGSYSKKLFLKTPL